MIVDLETRLWRNPEELGPELADAVRRLAADRWLAPDGNEDAHAAALSGLDGGLVIGFRSSLLGGAVDDSVLLHRCGTADGRLRLAIAVDPTVPGADATVEEARARGACAIWVDPALQGFHPADTRAMRVFDRAEANQLPVLVGWSGPQPAASRMEYARPFLLDEVGRAFPRLSLVISGFGHPFIGETVALLAKHDRFFTTTAAVAARPWTLLDALQSARDLGVEQKVLFASGFPFDTPSRAVEAIYAVNGMLQGSSLPAIPRSVLRDIVERDAFSLLGLGPPPTPRAATLERPLAAGLLPRLADGEWESEEPATGEAS